MRIISGKLKGRTINPPSNLRARPTTDFARESLFNLLSNMIGIEGSDVLDLFAGTGAVSYEFASRGASSVVSVEINALHHAFIRRTAAELDLGSLYPVKANAFLYLKTTPKRFDIIFSDAPYDLDGSEKVVDMVFGRDLLRPGGVFVFEHSKGKNFSQHPHFHSVRSYGSVHFSIFTFPG